MLHYSQLLTLRLLQQKIPALNRHKREYITIHIYKAQVLLTFYPYSFQHYTNTHSPNSPQQENFFTPLDNANEIRATRKLFHQTTQKCPLSSPCSSTPRASNKSNLLDAIEVLSRPQRNRKAPTFFGEPISSDLIYKLKNIGDIKSPLKDIFCNKSVFTPKT